MACEAVEELPLSCSSCNKTQIEKAPKEDCKHWMWQRGSLVDCDQPCSENWNLDEFASCLCLLMAQEQGGSSAPARIAWRLANASVETSAYLQCIFPEPCTFKQPVSGGPLCMRVVPATNTKMAFRLHHWSMRPRRLHQQPTSLCAQNQRMAIHCAFQGRNRMLSRSLCT